MRVRSPMPNSRVSGLMPCEAESGLVDCGVSNSIVIGDFLVKIAFVTGIETLFAESKLENK